jgi:hypothetical protein
MATKAAKSLNTSLAMGMGVQKIYLCDTEVALLEKMSIPGVENLNMTVNHSESRPQVDDASFSLATVVRNHAELKIIHFLVGESRTVGDTLPGSLSTTANMFQLVTVDMVSSLRGCDFMAVVACIQEYEMSKRKTSSYASSLRDWTDNWGISSIFLLSDLRPAVLTALSHCYGCGNLLMPKILPKNTTINPVAR